MKNLKGTKTEQNLINAFAGESQARNRYSFFAKVAKEEGYEQIAAIFLETAENEKEHAWRFFEQLSEVKANVNASYPYSYGTTEENLESAIKGEHEEWEILYAEGEKVAREEGFDDVADTFHHIINSEQHHYNRYDVIILEYDFLQNQIDQSYKRKDNLFHQYDLKDLKNRLL